MFQLRSPWRPQDFAIGLFVHDMQTVEGAAPHISAFVRCRADDLRLIDEKEVFTVFAFVKQTWPDDQERFVFRLVNGEVSRITFRVQSRFADLALLLWIQAVSG